MWMKQSAYSAFAVVAASLGDIASAQSSYASSSSCSATLTAKYPAPSVFSGYQARLVANNLTSPRGIKFDNAGNLLVVEQGKGVTALSFNDTNGCVSVSSRKTVVSEPELNHGIELSPDGTILYASSGDTLWAWDYSSSTQTNTSAPRPLVTGMAGSDHTSRTLLLSRKAPGMMLINRGSNSNLDELAADISTGHSQIRAFNITNATQPYDFNTAGLLLGWGLRNDVGIAEHPITGGIYSVENSADQVNRSDVDIHENNPAEKLNFLGYLNGTYSTNQGRNFGYPKCFAAWNASAIPDFKGTTGDQFAIGTPSATLNDTTCATDYQAPRLSFQAHMAPLDILFNPNGAVAWITFHGSWNRDSPVGYKLSGVAFYDGEPRAPRNSTTAAVDFVSNADLSKCPENCFRPVGLAWGPQGQLFMSSDSTGEIYVVTLTNGTPTDETGVAPTSSSGNATPSGAAARGLDAVSSSSFASILAAACAALLALV